MRPRGDSLRKTPVPNLKYQRGLGRKVIENLSKSIRRVEETNFGVPSLSMNFYDYTPEIA